MAESDDAPLTAVAASQIDDSTRTLFRELLARALQELIEDELTARIGAAAHERTATRTNRRNGHGPRTLSTPAGDVELAIPRPVPSFFPSLLEPRRRVDRALWAVIMTAYVDGVSTRKADDLVKALGVDSGVSKSTVSRICAELDEQIQAFGTAGWTTPSSRTCSATRPTQRVIVGLAGHAPGRFGLQVP